MRIIVSISGATAAVVVAIFIFATAASAFQSSGRSMIAVDFASGAVLAEKNADTPLPPASMSKIMTIYMAFEALEQGRLQLDEMLPVSRAAAAYRGSTMFLRAGERVSVEDLIRGVVVLSGNDASAVLAEALSPDGTEGIRQADDRTWPGARPEEFKFHKFERLA